MFSTVEEIQLVQEELLSIQKDYPELDEHIKHITSLTRQLQIKYQFLGKLIMDETEESELPHIRKSVLEVYLNEVVKFKENPNIEVFKNVLKNHPEVTYTKVFLIVLGMKPELVAKNTIIK